jgi:hypothetical protein
MPKEAVTLLLGSITIAMMFTISTITQHYNDRNSTHVWGVASKAADATPVGAGQKLEGSSYDPSGSCSSSSLSYRNAKTKMSLI